MHHNEWDKAALLEVLAHLFAYVVMHCLLHNGCFLGKRATVRGCPTWPGPLASCGEGVVIDHSCRNAPSVLSQVSDDVAVHRIPRSYTPPPVPLTGISN